MDGGWGNELAGSVDGDGWLADAVVGWDGDNWVSGSWDVDGGGLAVGQGDVFSLWGWEVKGSSGASWGDDWDSGDSCWDGFSDGAASGGEDVGDDWGGGDGDWGG